MRCRLGWHETTRSCCSGIPTVFMCRWPRWARGDGRLPYLGTGDAMQPCSHAVSQSVSGQHIVVTYLDTYKSKISDLDRIKRYPLCMSRHASRRRGCLRIPPDPALLAAAVKATGQSALPISPRLTKAHHRLDPAISFPFLRLRQFFFLFPLPPSSLSFQYSLFPILPLHLHPLLLPLPFSINSIQGNWLGFIP